MSLRTIEPQSGVGLVLQKGESLRIVDPFGEQVCDLIAYSHADPQAWLSSGRTFDYNNTVYLTTGHVLYSNRSEPMLTITADTVGRHDFLFTPCSAETFSIIYKTTGHHPSCLANITEALREYGIEQDRVPTTFNIFMNVSIAEDGALSIAPPRSRPGDSLTLRAEMDVIVALTACSAEMSNNYRFKPIQFEVQPNNGSPTAATDGAAVAGPK